jgi:hypothetical protein
MPRKPKMTYLKYLETFSDGQENYCFDDHTAAHTFGQRLRENVMKEEKLVSMKELESIIDISITYRTVRVKIRSEETSLVKC